MLRTMNLASYSIRVGLVQRPITVRCVRLPVLGFKTTPALPASIPPHNISQVPSEIAVHGVRRSFLLGESPMGPV